MNRTEIEKFLKTLQDNIVYESEEDEGAMEYYAEIQSLIDVVSNPLKTDEDVKAWSEHVGITLWKFYK